MTDHVPADTAIDQFAGPLPELLWSTLPQVAAAGRKEGLDRALVGIFRDGDQRNFVSRSPRACRGRRDAFANMGQIVGNSASVGHDRSE